MFRKLVFRQGFGCLLLGLCLFCGCENDIVFEPKYSIPTCYDGIKNQNEAGIDCGNSTCGPCFAPYEAPPCAQDVQLKKVMINQQEYTINQAQSEYFISDGEAIFETNLSRNDYPAGYLRITISEFLYLKKSTIYTLNKAEASDTQPPFYKEALVEFVPLGTYGSSKSSTGKLYVEVLDQQFIFTICGVLLTNTNNTSNTFRVSAQLTAPR
jgi:hypothetical protein